MSVRTIALVLMACVALPSRLTAGDLLVSSRFNSHVLRYDATTGRFVGVFASGYGMANPNGIAYGPDGNLYVGNGDEARVLKFDGQTGDFLGSFVTPATGGGLANCRAIAFGPDGNLYVDSGSTNQVLAYDGRTGAFLRVAAQGRGLNGPVGLTFGPEHLSLAVGHCGLADTDSAGSLFKRPAAAAAVVQRSALDQSGCHAGNTEAPRLNSNKRKIRITLPSSSILTPKSRPRLMPVPNIVEPPRAHASAIRSRPAPKLSPVTNAAVATTFTPADKMRTSSSVSSHIGLYTTQSGFSASSASTSSVAVTPNGAMPHSSPTSRPTFSADHA